MYCYLWEEKDHVGECKFGERWVFAHQDPEKECRRRIRESLGVRKDKFDEGGIRVVALWDVSDIAKTVGRYHKQSRMDDYLRAFIGFRKNPTGEIHLLSGDDMQFRVNRLLAKLGQPLANVGLSTKQHEVAIEVISDFKRGNRIILAELCARFGKTIWSGAVAVEMEYELTIVASYVKTVFTSFANDLTSFEQFSEHAHIDTTHPDYQKQIRSALKEGKKIFAYLSLANGSKRQQRIDFLFGRNVSKLLIVDEADFGAHRLKQAMPLIDKLKKDKKSNAIIMTGTNADKAATYFPIDTLVTVTYPELLIQKELTKNAKAI